MIMVELVNLWSELAFDSLEFVGYSNATCI